MRREFSAITAVSMVMLFLAATVVCLQIGLARPAHEPAFSSGVLWSAEIAVFGAAVYLWRRGIALGPWLLAVCALVAVRVAVTTVSAAAYGLVQPGESYRSGVEAMSEPLVRVCAALFSLVILSPLRGFLPLRLLGQRARPAPRAAAMVFPDAPAEAGAEPALWFVRGEEKIPVWLDARGSAGEIGARHEALAEHVDGHLELPLGAVLAQIPQEFITEKAGQHDPAEPVAIPLAMIVPQLREARIVVPLDQLAQFLPAGLLEMPRDWALGQEETPLILLPLDLVVPRLPEGTLELPPPSPPPWARLARTEQVVFARVPSDA